MLLYTSGSTGKPKGVNHVHGRLRTKCMIDQYPDRTSFANVNLKSPDKTSK
jgi:acyl-coenzyme A synthetase/AMP-(fatty) acid ligase